MKENLHYRLSMLTFLIGKATLPILVAHGISNHQWKVLGALYKIAPATAQQLTGLVTLDKSAVSRAVASLLELELIRRKSIAADGRTMHLFLTPRGKALYRRVEAELSAVQAAITADIHADGMSFLFASLDSIETRLKAAISAQPSAPDAAA
jgi:DNA-binding MarR family transcriptional regulator